MVRAVMTRNKNLRNHLNPPSRPRAERTQMADTSKKSQDSEQSGWRDFVDSLPLDELKDNFTDFASAWSENALKGLGDKVNDFVDNLGASGPMGKAVQKGMEKISEGDCPMQAGLYGAATGVQERVKEALPGGYGGDGAGGEQSIQREI